MGGGVLNPQDKIVTDLELVYDGKIVDSWKDKQWPEDMLSAMGWLILEQAKNRRKLKKGEIVLTGAWGPPIPLGDKSSVEVKSSAFGTVGATFL